MWVLNIGTLVALGSLAGPSITEKMASHIFYGGNIRTLDPSVPRVETLAIGQGRILALGRKSEVMSLAGPDTHWVDLKGRTLMPSLKDHHVHLLNAGFSVLNRKRNETIFLDLSSLQSSEEVARLVAERAAKAPAGTWILGKGWNQGAWGTNMLPTHHILDKAAPHHPVYLTRGDAHCGWVNLEALRKAGIAAETPDPPGGAIGRFKDGSLSGILLESANEAVVAQLPELADEEVKDAFREGAHSFAAQGITEIYDAGFLAVPAMVALNIPLHRSLRLLQEVDRSDPLPIRVNLMVPAPSSLADLVKESPESLTFSARIRITHIKLYMDGALGSRGAALRKPYADDQGTRGVLRMTESALEAEVLRAIDAGLDVATHAVGDNAIGSTLRVYEAVLANRHDLDPRRLRIEHFSYGTAEDIARTVRLGILNVIQPGFIYPDDRGVTMEDGRLGHERTGGAYAFGTLSFLGARLAGSSDDFTTLVPPFWNFYAAVTRMNPSGYPLEGWHPKERFAREDALSLFTRFYPAGGGDASPGRIFEEGPADLVILSEDPLLVDKSEILEIRVHATIRDGEVTFTDSSIEALR